MKRIIVVLLSLVLLTSCQPTPDQESIREKNTEALVELAGQQAGTDSTPKTQSDVPKKYTAELKSAVGKLGVSVDAQVYSPDCVLPLVRVIPDDFSESLIHGFAKALFGEQAHYVDPASIEHLTKGYYLRHAEALMDALDHWDEYGANRYDLIYETRADAQKALDVLTKKAADAPDVMPLFSPDFSEYQKHGNNGFFWVFAMDENDILSRMDVSNIGRIVELCYWRDADRSNVNVFPNPISVIGSLKISEKDAVQQAQAVLEQAGLAGFVCVKHYGMDAHDEAAETVPCYMCIFTRSINGVPITYANNGTAVSQYDQAWNQERVFVEIDDSGVLFLKYEAPLSLLETLSENCKLLTFVEIRDVFERRITVVNNEIDFLESDNRTERYVITEVRLGLVAIREKDKQTGLLVPAWDFLGYREISGPNGVTAEPFDSSYSFLTVNAIDGSIINRNLGY